MNEKMNFCVIHESPTEFPVGWDGECFITSCPPPDLPDNWIDFVVEPSPAELECMDIAAAELEGDFS